MSERKGEFSPPSDLKPLLTMNLLKLIYVSYMNDLGVYHSALLGYFSKRMMYKQKHGTKNEVLN